MIRAPFFRLGVAAVAGALAVTGLTVPAGAAPSAAVQSAVVRSAAVDRGTVQGTYTTDSGEPIAGAYVSVYSADYDWLRDGSTDADGRFTLRNVRAGGVKIQFQNNGIQQWAHDAADFDSATEFTLDADQTLTVDESQQPTGTIAGTLKTVTGEPAAWYAANLVSAADPSIVSSAFADETGRFSAAVLPGAYKVSFHLDSTVQWALQKADAKSADTFTVAAGQTVEVNDTLLPTGTLGGRLTTADGEPLADMRVTLHRPYDPTGEDGDGSVADVYTGGTGHYEFIGVLPGAYRISFAPTETGPRQWLRGTIDPARATVYRVVAGERTTADDAQLRTGTVQGKLIDPAGAPLEGYGVQVSQYSEDGWESYTATTGPDGSWRVDEVLPSTYVVRFENPDGTRRQWAYGKGTSEDAKSFVVAAGATVTVNDTWLPGATLVVTATDAVTGAPVSDFCGWLWSVNAGDCTSGSELTLTGLPGGELPLSITTGDKSFYLGVDDDRPVTLTPGETTTVSVPLAQGGKVAMTVTDAATGGAVADTCFVLVTPGQGGLGDGYGDCTNAAGKSSTGAKAPGTYQLFAVGRNGYGHQWVGKTGGTGDQRQAAKITVRAGKVTKAPAVLLDKAATVTGTVTGEDGEPIPYANVAYSAWGYGVGPSHDTDAGEDGRYTLNRLGPYSWPLVFTTGIHARQWSGGTGNRFQAELIQLSAGAGTTYNMALKHGSSVKGVVSIAPGARGGQWRLNAVNAVTGDPAGVADSYNTENGAYEMLLAGGQQIKISWSLYGEGAPWQDGWYDNAIDMASATKVAVPKTGSKKLNLVVGRP